jgi:hypothetical protein
MTKTSKTALTVAAILAIGLTLLVWQAMTGFSATLKLFEGLSVSAPANTLHVGESTRLTVQRKRGLVLHEKLQRPDATTYFTVSESELVVEPDGQVTCVGMGGRAKDEIWVFAENGRDRGHISCKSRHGSHQL